MDNKKQDIIKHSQVCFGNCPLGIIFERKILPLFFKQLFNNPFKNHLRIINVSHHHGLAQQFYLEPQYSILSVFLAFPLMYSVLPNIKSKVGNLVLPLVILSCFIRILTVGEEYKERINWISSMKDKRILDKEDVPVELLKMTWATPYEFWLISTIDNGRTSSLITQKRVNQFHWIKECPQHFLTRWGAFEYEDLNSDYFIMRDTIHSYKEKCDWDW